MWRGRSRPWNQTPMAVVVIGGHSRSVGKTSVVAGLIAALSDYPMDRAEDHAVRPRSVFSQRRILPLRHRRPLWAISEEKDRSGDSDTSRFLVAGAVRALWVRTEQGRLAEAIPTIRRRLAESENVILESNSILKFVRPDLYLTVLDPATADFKRSAQEFLDRADAVVLHAPKKVGWRQARLWTGISLKPVAGRPIFEIRSARVRDPRDQSSLSEAK